MSVMPLLMGAASIATEGVMDHAAANDPASADGNGVIARISERLQALIPAASPRQAAKEDVALLVIRDLEGEATPAQQQTIARAIADDPLLAAEVERLRALDRDLIALAEHRHRSAARAEAIIGIMAAVERPRPVDTALAGIQAPAGSTIAPVIGGTVLATAMGGMIPLVGFTAQLVLDPVLCVWTALAVMVVGAVVAAAARPLRRVERSCLGRPGEPSTAEVWIMRAVGTAVAVGAAVWLAWI